MTVTVSVNSQSVLKYTAEVPWLEGCGENVYSQFGEDGLIASILERVGTTNKECFEVGAGDGRHLSNTRRLVELGWHALWIESSAEQFMKLLQDIPGDVDAIPALITPWNVNKILETACRRGSRRDRYRRKRLFGMGSDGEKAARNDG